MSERKVLNKYYPPDFDPSKIPRVKGSKNRQFTVRLMAPCNMKCYTCGEYIAKGKKFNARKEDVDDMNFLGIRIYRFYIRCPGCISEISFRTDPASTDYVLEAGAHRNFQALKLAEEQAAREAKEAQDEIESNPMLLLENRTQQSQYEMDLLETLEDLRDQNDRHAGVDLSAVAGKYQKERELTAEQMEEQERMEACIALGYEMIEGKLVKRLKDEDLNDELPTKKIKVEGSSGPEILTAGKSMDPKKYQNSLKAKLNGVVRKKPQSSLATSDIKTEPHGSGAAHNTISIPDPDRIKMPPPSRIRRLVQNNSSIDISSSASRASALSSALGSELETSPSENSTLTSEPALDQTCKVEGNPLGIKAKETDDAGSNSTANGAHTSCPSSSSSLSLLGQYSDSSSGSDED